MSSKKILIIIIGFLIFIFINNNNFFRKFFNIIKIEHSTRLSDSGGFCHKDSIGYLKYLKNKYLFEFNPKVINFENSSPNSNWAIYDNNMKDNDRYKILLNYPKEMDMHFKQHDKIFLTNDTAVHAKGIKKIIFDLNQQNMSINAEIIIYRKNLSNSKKEIIYRKKINESILDNVPILIEYETLKINSIYKSTFIELIGMNNKQINNIEKIILSLEHNFKIANSEILDNYENCYYIYD